MRTGDLLFRAPTLVQPGLLIAHRHGKYHRVVHPKPVDHLAQGMLIEFEAELDEGAFVGKPRVGVVVDGIDHVLGTVLQG